MIQEKIRIEKKLRFKGNKFRKRKEGGITMMLSTVDSRRTVGNGSNSSSCLESEKELHF